MQDHAECLDQAFPASVRAGLAGAKIGAEASVQDDRGGGFETAAVVGHFAAAMTRTCRPPITRHIRVPRPPGPRLTRGLRRSANVRAAAHSPFRGVPHVFEALSDKLTGVFDRLRGRGALSEADVTEALREVRSHCSAAWVGSPSAFAVSHTCLIALPVRCGEARIASGQAQGHWREQGQRGPA